VPGRKLDTPGPIISNLCKRKKKEGLLGAGFGGSCSLALRLVLRGLGMEVYIGGRGYAEQDWDIKQTSLLHFSQGKCEKFAATENVQQIVGGS
jgi:hypothetical protein